MKTLLILMLALCSLSAGEKTNYASVPIGFSVITNYAYLPATFWSAELTGRIETNWIDSYWQTETGTVSTNTYIVTDFHGKTTTNLIESVTVTNLTRRYNIKQVRDYNGPFNDSTWTNAVIWTFNPGLFVTNGF